MLSDLDIILKELNDNQLQKESISSSAESSFEYNFNLLVRSGYIAKIKNSPKYELTEKGIEKYLIEGGFEKSVANKKIELKTQKKFWEAGVLSSRISIFSSLLALFTFGILIIDKCSSNSVEKKTFKIENKLCLYDKTTKHMLDSISLKNEVMLKKE